VLQPALPAVRNRLQGPSRDPALLAPRVPRSAPLGDPPQRHPGQRRSCSPSGQSARSRRMPRDRSIRPRICRKRVDVKELSASCKMKYRACRHNDHGRPDEGVWPIVVWKTIIMGSTERNVAGP